MSDDNLTLLRELKRHTGLVTRLRPFDTVLKVTTEPTRAAILIDTFSVDELVREYRFVKHGQRLTSFYRTSCGWLQQGQSMTVWDKDFESFTLKKFGRSVSPREYLERRKWERDCYRVGSDITPLDSYQRVLDAPTHPKMERFY